MCVSIKGKLNKTEKNMKYRHVSAYEARLKDRNMQDMPGDERALETMFFFLLRMYPQICGCDIKRV